MEHKVAPYRYTGVRGLGAAAASQLLNPSDKVSNNRSSSYDTRALGASGNYSVVFPDSHKNSTYQLSGNLPEKNPDTGRFDAITEP